MKVLVNCFYYSFYMDKKDLGKFKFPNDTAIEDIKELCLINNKTTIKKVKTQKNLLNDSNNNNNDNNINITNKKLDTLIDIFKNLFKNHDDNNCSNRLSNTKILEQLKYLYHLLTLINCNLTYNKFFYPTYTKL